MQERLGRFIDPRRSAVPYLAALIIGLTIATYLQHLLQYVNYNIPVIKGQSPFIWMSGLTALVAFLLWLPLPWRPAPGRWFRIFLGSMLLGWLVRTGLLFVHGDSFNYTLWLTPVVLIMISLKSPDSDDARSTMLVLGWSGSILLLWTRLSEIIALIPMHEVSPGLLAFEIQEYWLPLAGWLGPEGRWPGPLGGTAYTGMLGALLLVLAVSMKAKSSWAFAAIGIITLLLTSSRGSFAAAAAGIGIAIVFGNSHILRKVPFGWRLTTAATGGLATLILLLQASPNLTGRTTFWPDFIDLWLSSPLRGVGASGYAAGTEWTQTAGTAHSLYIDELARNGIVGFISLLAALVAAFVLGLTAAKQGSGGPLALLTTLAVLGIANTPFSWTSPSFIWLFLLLSVAWAACQRTDRFTSPTERDWQREAHFNGAA